MGMHDEQRLPKDRDATATRGAAMLTRNGEQYARWEPAGGTEIANAPSRSDGSLRGVLNPSPARLTPSSPIGIWLSPGTGFDWRGRI